MLEKNPAVQIAEVLIVEDDAELRSVLVFELRSLGFSPLTAKDGAQALHILQEKSDQISAVISDWLMPNLDGLGLLKKMRADRNLQEIPFLLLTAKGSEDDIVQGFNHGANDYIRKPFKFGELTARLKNLVLTRNLMKQLKEQAVRDGLTGLYNYRYFMECLPAEVSRQQRYGGELSLIMLDIDHFKQLNDRYGHQSGDFVLKCLGMDIKDSLRTVDTPCRYGGEEFAVILPMTGLAGAEIVAERLRKNIEQAIFEREASSYSITCSFGVGSLDRKSISSHDFIQSVDRALYNSKDKGRNMVSLAEL